MALDIPTSSSADTAELEAQPQPVASLAAIGGPRKRSSLGKRLLLAALVLTALALIVFAMTPRPIAVESTTAVRARMRVTVDEDGVARIEDRYVISAPMSGRLERIEAKAGDQVQRGVTLARLMPAAAPMLDERTRSEAEARLAMTVAAQHQSEVQVERASVRYQYAKEDAERKRGLEHSGAVAHSLVDDADLLERTAATELESLRFARQVADHEAEMARATLGRLQHAGSLDQFEIHAPVDGKILRLIQSSEGVVQSGTPLLEIGDPKALEIAIDVLTSDAVRIKPAALVLFERWGGPTLEGRVRRVEPSAFTRISALGVEEQRVNVIVDLTSPPEVWAALGDGYRVEARIIVWEAEDVLQIPGSAVFRHESSWATFRVVDGAAVITPLEIGERTPSSVEVKRGLAAGERVIVHPSDRVANGVRVNVR